MTKASFESMEGLEVPEDAPVYSKDYWDLVFEQLGKRQLFKVGMAILAILYGIAIYAPFIANDRPYRIEGVDLKGYQSSIGVMGSVPSGMGRLVKISDEDFLANLENQGTLGKPEKTPQTRGGALEKELNTLEDRVTLVLGYLPPDLSEPREGLRAMLEEARGGVARFEAGENEAALEAFNSVKKQARAYRKELKPLDPSAPEKGGVDLVAKAETPLWDDLPPVDVFFMVFWGFVLLWPIWNRLINGVLGGNRDKIRRWRFRKWGGVFAISAACAFGWWIAFGAGGNINSNASFKQELLEGKRVAIQAGTRLSDTGNEFEIPWAPLRYGVAESNQEEQFRPPTWLEYSKTDENGAYVPKGGAKAEAVEGTAEFKGTFNPVIVRPGEPSRDAWNRHISGTDETGRDFFTRIIWGSRTSLTVGILSAALLTIIGIFFGALAGYFGGWVDVAIMRLIEVLQSIPAFFLILLTLAFIPPSLIKPIFAIVIVIALIRWTGTARLVRGEFMRLREQEFVVASRALGFSNARTIFRHVLPNAMSPVLVSAAFAVAAGILTESAISFLGFGIKPPEASWGSLVSETRNPSYWWVQVFPGILIFITVTCYNLVGDAIRDAMDPKMKE